MTRVMEGTVWILRALSDTPNRLAKILQDPIHCGMGNCFVQLRACQEHKGCLNQNGPKAGRATVRGANGGVELGEGWGLLWPKGRRETWTVALHGNQHTPFENKRA